MTQQLSLPPVLQITKYIDKRAPSIQQFHLENIVF